VCSEHGTQGSAHWVGVDGDTSQDERLVAPFPRVARDAGIASTRAGRGLLRGSCGSRPPPFAAAASATLAAVPAPVHGCISLEAGTEGRCQRMCHTAKACDWLHRLHAGSAVDDP